MALVLLDRARETTIVVGTTASAILLGAVSGYQSLAGVGNGNTTYYCIAEQTGTNWEVGLGTYTLVGTILTRAATPLSSSNAGASVSFPAGTKDIFIVYPSAKGVWLDASGNAIGLGTPAAFVGTNITGTATAFTASNVTTNANLTGAITSVGNVTSLGSFTSANLATALTDETGSGANVFATSPTLVTPALGTPSALVGTNITGTATAFTASNVTTNANLTGAITSVGNVTSLGSFTSANLATALTDETGSGANVFATSPTLVTPALGTPSALVGTNITGTATGLTVGNATNAVTANTANAVASGITITSPVIAGTPSGVGTLTSMTNVATTSGTAFLFTGVPSWAKRITVMINGCVYNAATQILIQLGSTTLVTSGYVSYGNVASVGFASTAGYIAAGANATNSYYISAVLNLQTGNTWLCAMGGVIVNAGAGVQFNAGGTGATSSAVDRINITTVSGATWTAGSINIMYE